MKIRLGLLILCLLVSRGGAQTPRKPETPRLEFVKRFIHDVSAIEDIRDKGEKDLKQGANAAFTNLIHSGTLFKLELGAQSRSSEGVQLHEPFDTRPSNLSDFYKNKYEIWDEMVEIARQSIGGPKPGADCPKLGAEMPELRAKQEYLDERIFQGSHSSNLVVAQNTAPTPEKPASRPPPVRRVTVPGEAMKKMIVKKVQPQYPPSARQSRVSGTVIIQIVIDTKGNVSHLELVSGDPRLVPSTVEAVRQWKYKPPTVKGEPVEVDTTVDVVYSLNE